MSEQTGTPEATSRWSMRRKSVRPRLLMLALLPTLVVLPALLSVGNTWWSAQVDSLLTTKVHGDLTIAHQYVARLMEHQGDALIALGRSAELSKQLGATAQPGIEGFLAAERNSLGLDFLLLVDGAGKTLASATPSGGETAVISGKLQKAALSARAETAIDVVTADELEALSPPFEARARIELVATEGAMPTDRKVETRGIVIHSAAPVEYFDRARLMLVGGILLNRNLAFIDTINDLVYRAASLPDGSQGTATLFLDDVRVSTNVRLFADTRALGTRVSSAVRQAVLGEGRVWLDRAFVVNDWYISAYEPIVDSGGERIGMLYVGFLEKPFKVAKQSMLLAVLAAFALTSALLVPLLLWWARSIFFPLEQMNATIERVESGNLAARTGPTGRNDEIARVAQQLDHLLDGVQDRDRKLRDWANELDSRVNERTRELREANERLEAARRRLVMSEKLAAIGEITAGVAHEINNPIAVIQGNIDVARERLGALADPVRKEFDLIEAQVHRMNLIVTRLLQFAKPEEFAGYTEVLLAGPLIEDSLVLVRNQLSRGRVEVERRDEATREVIVNRTELQQVLINLMVNAVHAMPDGGKLRIRTYDKRDGERDGVAIDVADSGVGIAPENIERIFNAFFTTRPQRGTGLGLSVSATLLARYGGTISVQSQQGVGSTFTVWLPSEEGAG